jgi:hypothetical protein
MIRKLMPLAVAIVLVAVCNNQSPSTDRGDPPAGGGAPNVTYTIKVRDEAQGDKTLVVITENSTATITTNGKTASDKNSGKAEYTEEILDMPAGARKPNKLTRAYKTFEKTGPNAKPPAVAGKTVTIEKGANGQYTAKVDGRPLPSAEANVVLGSLNRPDGITTADTMPKGPVKLNESWTVDAETVRKFGASAGYPFDPAKSSMTGKLTKVYAKDGRQWGVIEMHLQAAGADDKGKVSMTVDMTLDIPIDGSAHIGTVTVKGKIALNEAGLGSFVVDLDEVQTRTQVK